MSGNNKIGNGVVIGIDIGGTKVSGALFSSDGCISPRAEILLEGRGGSDAGSLVTDLVQEQLKLAAERKLEVESIAVCVPGISNKTNQTVWAPNIKGWAEYPLKKEIRSTVDNPHIPVSVESDRACYILGEMWKGNARDCSDAIFMAVGTGIGIGIVANGHIIDGSRGIAGAAGWMALNRPFQPEYVHCGNLEYYASGTGIARAAEKLLKERDTSQYLVAGKVSSQDIFLAIQHHDPVAVKVIDQAIGYWGMAVANLVSIFNPEKIIFGGGVFGPAVQFIDRIYDEALKWGQPISMKQVKLEESFLKGEAGLTGAGYLAIQNSSRSQN